LRSPLLTAVPLAVLAAAICGCEGGEPEAEPVEETVEPVLEFSTMYLPPAFVLLREREGEYSGGLQALAELDAELVAKGVAPAGPPFVHYLGTGSDGDRRFQVGVSVSSDVKPWGDFLARELPERLVAYLETSGPYSDTRAWEHEELTSWASSAGFEITGDLCEYYLNWGTEGLPESLMAEVTLPIAVPEEPEE
jgi:effector-binding domain-containing protein